MKPCPGDKVAALSNYLRKVLTDANTLLYHILQKSKIFSALLRKKMIGPSPLVPRNRYGSWQHVTRDKRSQVPWCIHLG